MAPTASVAVDCDDTSATAFRNVSVRTDGDGDAYCVGAAFSTCVGATIPSGLRLPTSCESTDDCNDAAPTVFRYADTRPDNDGDGYCKGEAATTCIGAAAPSGRKIATECVATDDCDDNSSEVFRFEMTRKDSDNDTYCTDAAVNSCIGNGAPAGRRIQANCGVTDDCDDNLSSAYRWASVKKDVDGDQYCAGNATNLCIGATPPATWRIASTCLVGDDCGDTNPLIYRNMSVRTDADNDGACVNVPRTVCMGQQYPAGQRAPDTCRAEDDCLDTNSSQWRVMMLRADADEDTYCAAATLPYCVGATQPPKTRVPSQCNPTSDCSETNPHAGATCLFTRTFVAAKECGIGPAPRTTYTFTWDCGLGFKATQRTDNSSGGASVASFVVSPFSAGFQGGTMNVTSECQTSFGSYNFEINVKCSAN